jgi:hypothetical protein
MESLFCTLSETRNPGQSVDSSPEGENGACTPPRRSRGDCSTSPARFLPHRDWTGTKLTIQPLGWEIASFSPLPAMMSVPVLLRESARLCVTNRKAHARHCQRRLVPTKLQHDGLAPAHLISLGSADQQRRMAVSVREQFTWNSTSDPSISSTCALCLTGRAVDMYKCFVLRPPSLYLCSHARPKHRCAPFTIRKHQTMSKIFPHFASQSQARGISNPTLVPAVTPRRGPGDPQAAVIIEQEKGMGCRALLNPRVDL